MELIESICRSRPELSPGAKVALSLTYLNFEREGWYVPTVELARLMGCSIRQTRRYLAELSASGDLPRGGYRWLEKMPASARLDAAMPRASEYRIETAAGLERKAS